MEILFHRSIRYSSLENGSAGQQTASDESRRKQIKGSTNAANHPNVLIIDNVGLLSRLYRYGTIAYVGGGFGDDGVHNVLEAAVYGKPVVFGPVIEKYAEALELVDCGGGIVIDSAIEDESVFTSLLSDQEEYALHCEASKNYVYSNRGATDHIVKYIQENRLLTNW
jgi:3-deoxy-D-manno-octulosonic-acid transferase